MACDRHRVWIVGLEESESRRIDVERDFVVADRAVWERIGRGAIFAGWVWLGGERKEWVDEIALSGLFLSLDGRRSLSDRQELKMQGRIARVSWRSHVGLSININQTLTRTLHEHHPPGNTTTHFDHKQSAQGTSTSTWKRTDIASRESKKNI